MNIYKNSNGQWVVGDKIIPAGQSIVEIKDDKLTITLLSRHILLFLGSVSDLKREDGSTYEDVATFLSECADFFVNPLNPLQEEVEGMKSELANIPENALLMHSNNQIADSGFRVNKYYSSSRFLYKNKPIAYFNEYSNIFDITLANNINSLRIGEGSNNIEIGTYAINRVQIGLSAKNITAGFGSEYITIGGGKTSQIISIYRGASIYGNVFPVFHSTNTDTRIAGATPNDMNGENTVLIMRPELTLKASGYDIIRVNTEGTKPIVFGNNSYNDIEVRGFQNAKFGVTGSELIISTVGSRKLAQLYANETYIGKAYSSDLALSKLYAGYNKVGDVIRVDENDNYFYIASDPDKPASNKIQKVRVGEYANDVEVGSNAGTVSLGHAANNVYVRGANTYMDKLPTIAPADGFQFLMLDGNKKVYSVNKETLKAWLNT